MDTICTNFSEDLDAPCSYCGKPHREHIIDVGEIEGRRCLHHQPCVEQLRALDVEFSPPKVGLVSRLLNQFRSHHAA